MNILFKQLTYAAVLMITLIFSNTSFAAYPAFETLDPVVLENAVVALRGELDIDSFDLNNQDTRLWFEYGTDKYNLSLQSSKEYLSQTNGIVYHGITGLKKGTSYYYRSVLDYDDTYIYGSIKSFSLADATSISTTNRSVNVIGNNYKVVAPNDSIYSGTNYIPELDSSDVFSLDFPTRSELKALRLAREREKERENYASETILARNNKDLNQTIIKAPVVRSANGMTASVFDARGQNTATTQYPYGLLLLFIIMLVVILLLVRATFRKRRFLRNAQAQQTRYDYQQPTDPYQR